MVILTISKNNPVESAKEATFKEDLRSFQDDLALTISKEYTDKQGQRDEKINAAGESVKNYISSFTDKYVGKFIIENDKLVGTDKLTKKEKEWAEDLEISSDVKTWDITATPEECFEWEGTAIVGINTDMLTDKNKLKIPSKCTEINPKYVSTYESYRSFMPELQEIEIPETVIIIGDYAFHNAQGIKSIVIPDSVTSIGEEAFSYCINLENVTIGNNLTSIGNYAFGSCSNLTNITIPNSVTSIGDRAFSNCISLENITIPDSVTYIGCDAFSGTPWYENKADGEVYIGKVLYEYKGNMPEDTSIIVKDGTKSISECAFFNCNNLTNITIPNSVTSIGDRAFDGCSSLTNIAIPDSVTSIGYGTFSWCSSLTNIIMPNSVTSIDDSVFYKCSSLTNINFSGTKAEWNNINKDSNWNYNSALKTITCTDGTITL